MASGARDRKMSGRATELLGNFGNSARESEAKILTQGARVQTSTDVHPANPACPARAYGLHECLFRCEAECELRRVAPESAAVRDLGRREDALLESLAALGEKALDARDLDHVNAAADDHTPSIPIASQ